MGGNETRQPLIVEFEFRFASAPFEHAGNQSRIGLKREIEILHQRVTHGHINTGPQQAQHDRARNRSAKQQSKAKRASHSVSSLSATIPRKYPWPRRV